MGDEVLVFLSVSGWFFALCGFFFARSSHRLAMAWKASGERMNRSAENSLRVAEDALQLVSGEGEGYYVCGHNDYRSDQEILCIAINGHEALFWLVKMRCEFLDKLKAACLTEGKPMPENPGVTHIEGGSSDDFMSFSTGFNRQEGYWCKRVEVFR